MNKKHTPGEWQLKMWDENHAVIYDAEGNIVVPRMICEKGNKSGASLTGFIKMNPGA